MSRIQRIDAGQVVFDDPSGYRGVAGLRAFRNCAKMPNVEPGRGKLVESNLDQKLSAALFDLIEEGGFVSSWASFADNVQKIGWMSDIGQNHLSYLKFASRTVYDPDYCWFESTKFAEEYPNRHGTDGTSLACDTWFPRMLLLGEGRSGELFMANPVVRTTDGEWEGWLWNHSYPGAYRFASVADMLGHCYLESRNERNDCPRFERSLFSGTCAQWLVC